MYWSRQALVLLVLMTLQACSSFDKQPETDPAAQTDPQAELRRQLEQDYSRALSLQQQGEAAEAVAIYQRILERQPELTSPRYNLAQLSLEQGEQEQAIEYLQGILELQPKHKQAHNLMGMILREQGSFEAAEQHYRSALEADPDFAPALRNLAILLDLYQGRLQEALGYYQHYQSVAGEADPRVKDWIFDLKRRLGES